MKKFQSLLVLLLLASCAVLAQKKTITGKVTSKNTTGPLEGVNILAEGQKGGVSTKKDGTYSITVNAKAKTLIFSYVGYVTQTVLISDSQTVDVVLVAATTTEPEVVVIGYGTVKKSSLTGAVAKFTPERLEETPNSRLDQALQGKIAGVRVQNISSEAGEAPRVQVRGIQSISANASPLVVVDGHPLYEGLSFVNMADVQSVEVLKDASSAAIYGSRGANGVIIVTTKSGKANKTKFGVKFSTGAKQAYELYPMMSTTEYTNLLFYEASLRLQDPSITVQPAILTTNERAAYVIENQIRGGVGTDWQREAIRSASVQNIQLSASGGNAGVKYYLSGGYQNDQGMMYHSEYERFTVKAKIDADLSKKVKMSFNFNPSYIKRERPATTYTDFFRLQSFLPVTVDASIIDFVRLNPTYANTQIGDFAQANMFNNRVYSGLMPDGSNWVTSSASNPFATANQSPKSIMETVKITGDEYRALTTADMSFEILPGLTFKTMGSAFIRYSKGLDFGKTNSRSVGYVSTGVYTSLLYVDLLNENTLSYSKRIKDHSFDVVAAFTVQKIKERNEQITATNYANDNITTLNTATVVANPSQTFNTTISRGLLSGLGRIVYGYKDKYLLNVSLRADGSSYFGPGYKWGSFPSASIGWVASKEKFLQKVDWLSSLKLRASYGVIGNNAIGDYLFVDQLFPVNYPFGVVGTVLGGQAVSRTTQSNEAIGWEQTYSFNGGIDVALFKNKISFSIDVYRSRTDELLLNQATMGFTGVPNFINNVGSVENKGIEFEITSNNIRKRDFKWTTMANISRTRNKILDFGGTPFIQNLGERSEVYRSIVGQPIVQYYGYKTDGVWISQEEITKSGLTTSIANILVPGGLKIADVDGSGNIDANDRTILGNPYPDFVWGITNNFNYKAFDLSLFLQGTQGGKLINGDANYNETKRYNRNYNANRWVSPAFPGDGKTPYSTLGQNWMLTDYVVEDASFYSLREVIVGYTLPESFAKKARISSLRIYFSGQNLFYQKAKGFRGLNPEARSTGTLSSLYGSPLVDGYQRGAFPVQKTFLFGIDFNF
jgi:TonB-dependent starch-binding outer membrane protein SusC